MEPAAVRERFDRGVFYGAVAGGKLKSALAYAGRFPDQAELLRKYESLFREERYLAYDVERDLNEILLLYQKYYRDAFYLEVGREEAEARLQKRLADLFQRPSNTALDDLEERAAEAFRRRSFHFLGGRTGGYRGPYIWREEELRRYAVELPEGVQDYAVKLLDGFVSRSWAAYLSFGAAGTGGWSNGGGLIHCVREAYDLESEDFLVSLLKHEAQHASDLARYPGMSSGDLEYRAKLVELIYSNRRSLLDQFARQADGAGADNGHALAAWRIVRGFARRLNRPLGQPLPIGEVQAAARALFAESREEMERKYR